MISRHRTKTPARQRGQSALIGVLALIVLSVGMYTSYALSKSVYEKIQLQNAADATAFSLATMEARTFNFIAFANRAQVANYVQVLEAQAILTNALYLEGALGFGGDVLTTIGNNLITLSYIPLPGMSALGPIGESLVQVGQVMDTTREALTAAIDLWDSGQIQQNYMRRQGLTNRAFFAVSSMLAMTTLAQLGDGAHHIAEANDPDAERNVVSFIMNGANALSYATAFDLSAAGLGSDDNKQKAQRVMTELVNASRFGTAPRRMIVRRRAADWLVGGFTENDFGSAVDGLEEANSRDLPGGLNDAISSALGFILGPDYVGTTKLVTAGNGGSIPDADVTGEEEPDASGLSAGDAIVSKDVSRLPYLRMAKNGFASVTSTTDHSRICRYEKPDNWGAAPITAVARIIVIGLFTAGTNVDSRLGFKCYDENEKDYTWKVGGIGPFLKFAPKTSGISAAHKSFNQPDVWIYLHKGGTELNREGPELDFEIRQRGQQANFDGSIGGTPGLMSGMHAVARAQVYYHRPGAWKEPPNFFNPYWGARLAPKGAAIHRLMRLPGVDLGAFGTFIGDLVADNVWMH